MVARGATLQLPVRHFSPPEPTSPHRSPCSSCSPDFLERCHFQESFAYFPQLLSLLVSVALRVGSVLQTRLQQ